jgi:hypothetical protein
MQVIKMRRTLISDVQVVANWHRLLEPTEAESFCV